MAKWQYYIFPVLLIACLPAEVAMALIRRTYPTQATVLVVLDFIIGLWLAQQISKHAAKLAPEPVSPPPDIQEEVLDATNSRLNRMLGAGFLVFGFLLTLFMLVSFVMTTPRSVANATVLSTIIETGFSLMFNLLIAAVVWFGAKVYLTGLSQTQSNSGT
jgi:hypothetical protein